MAEVHIPWNSDMILLYYVSVALRFAIEEVMTGVVSEVY